MFCLILLAIHFMWIYWIDLWPYGSDRPLGTLGRASPAGTLPIPLQCYWPAVSCWITSSKFSSLTLSVFFIRHHTQRFDIMFSLRH